MNYDPIHDTYSEGNSVVNGSNTSDMTVDPELSAVDPNISAVEPTAQILPTVLSVQPTTEPKVEQKATPIKNGTENDADSESEEEDEKKTKRPVSASIPKGVRYLKKSDGEPFWRKDIQYDFLESLFENDQRVFTNNFPYCTVPGFYGGAKYTFAELYVRTLAESSKCSKILKERLLKDFDMGKSVAKVCLLVNTGRMNTTINFVPEMRSTLRTYHSIPSLQADSVSGTSKPLQDTPRLKSILKAVSDSKEDFKSIDDLLAAPPQQKPNTNLVLLLFLLSNNVNGIKYHHLHTETCTHQSNSFMEFFLETNIHPANRAKRFLWLMYTYLETSFKDEELAQNPFGGSTMPEIEMVPDSELNNFDKDTDYEIEYSDKMFRTRLKYLADEEHNNNPKRGNKRKEKEEDFDDEPEDKRFDDKAIDKKRKKLGKLPIVASPIYTEDKNDEDFIASARHPVFPLKTIKNITDLNKSLTLRADEPDMSLSRSANAAVLSKSKQIFKDMNDEELQKGTNLLRQWITRYFQYKKSTTGGLLAMEWEDIRYDIAHGIEDYLYEFKGELLLKGDIPIESFSKREFEPRYDYEVINERTEYIYTLINYSKDWIRERFDGIKIDIEREVITSNP